MPKMLETACIENEDDKVIKYLTGTRPVPTDVRNKESETCLMIACKNKSSSVVDVILGFNFSNILWVAFGMKIKDATFQYLHFMFVLSWQFEMDKISFSCELLLNLTMLQA